MDLWGSLGTLVAVSVGWGLNEIGQAIRQRRADKRSIGVILYDLLRTRIAILETKETLGRLKKELTLSPSKEEELIERHRKDHDVDQLIADYRCSVRETARFEPVLALELETASYLLKKYFEIRAMLSRLLADDTATKIEHETLKTYLPVLDSMIRKVARIHGKRTLDSVEAALKRPIAVPQYVQQIFQQAREDDSSSAEPGL